MQQRQTASLIGVDISAYQTITDPAVLYSKANYIYLRAYGSSHTAPDTTFLARAAQARSYGCPVGAYYFATPTTPVTTSTAEIDGQVEQFASVLEQAFGPGDYGDLVPMLDVESWDSTTPQKPMYYGLTGTQLKDWVLSFKSKFFTRTKRRLGFYTNRFFLQDATQMHMTEAEISAWYEMPFWLAEYDKWYAENTAPTGAPASLGGWTTYAAWQYTEGVEADQWGVSHFENKIDLNRTDSLDRLRPPRPVQDLILSDEGNGDLLITIVKPIDIDYLGASVYLNGVYRGWITKTGTSLLIQKAAMETEHTVTVYTEDITHDTAPASKKITLAAPAPPPVEEPPPVEPPPITGSVTPMQRGITTETVNRLLINEGVVYLNYGEVGERKLGATRGGTEFSIEQDIHTPEIDGAKGPLKGTRRVVESIAKLSTELLELSKENLMLAIVGADSQAIAEVTGPPIVPAHDRIRRDRELAITDYLSNVAVIGELSDGREIVVILYNALNEENMTVGQEDRNEATLPIVFTAHYDPADVNTEPWEIRYPAEV